MSLWSFLFLLGFRDLDDIVHVHLISRPRKLDSAVMFLTSAWRPTKLTPRGRDGWPHPSRSGSSNFALHIACWDSRLLKQRDYRPHHLAQPRSEMVQVDNLPATDDTVTTGLWGRPSWFVRALRDYLPVCTAVASLSWSGGWCACTTRAFSALGQIRDSTFSTFTWPISSGRVSHQYPPKDTLFSVLVLQGQLRMVSGIHRNKQNETTTGGIQTAFSHAWAEHARTSCREAGFLLPFLLPLKYSCTSHA